MKEENILSPLLGDDWPLDDARRALIHELAQAEDDTVRNAPVVDPDHRRRVELTWTEMQEQPQAIQRTLDLEQKSISEAASFFSSQRIDRMCLVGCGDSWISMIGVRALFERLHEIPCEPMQALDFAYYYHRPVTDRTLVVALSSSGATPRVVEALLMAESLGAQTLALSNTAGSPLMKAAQRGILIHATRNGWPTQSSTAAMAVLYQLGIDLARKKGVASTQCAELESSLHGTPRQIAAVLEKHNDGTLAIAEAEVNRPVYLFAGGGPALASAMFGAAKVKETTLEHSYAIPQEEYHHYLSQRAGDPLVLIAPAGPSHPRALQTARLARRYQGQVYGVISEGDSILKGTLNVAFELPRMDELLSPMVFTVPAQMFAFHLAMAKFRVSEGR